MEENQKNLYVKSDEEAANDLTKLLQQLFNKDKTLNQSPLFIVAESYGGKIAVKLGLSVFESVKSGQLKLPLGGKDIYFSILFSLNKMNYRYIIILIHYV